MSSDIKELQVAEYEHGKKVMYFAKDMLRSSEKLNIVATTRSSAVASRAAETLVRLGYVTFENIQTLTEIKNDRRSIKLIITLKKTSNFQKLYEENEKFKKEKAKNIDVDINAIILERKEEKQNRKRIEAIKKSEREKWNLLKKNQELKKKKANVGNKKKSANETY